MIAMSAAIGSSHNMLTARTGPAIKIVPGLTMAALSFGHLPSACPSGPMASGLPNGREGSCIRQLYGRRES
ncbi:hypothetical protein MJ575_18785 [Klebsiella pneumoniae]|nr:hypothetical protein MJ575_18785 [Klebsiella pneumoniae]